MAARLRAYQRASEQGLGHAKGKSFHRILQVLYAFGRVALPEL